MDEELFLFKLPHIWFCREVAGVALRWRQIDADQCRPACKIPHAGVYWLMRLHLYILRAHAGPFVFSLGTLMFIFLLQFIMKFIDQLVGKGLSWWVISELIALNLAWMVVLAVPMSVLVATLMAFGTMSANNEITAIKASGMSLYKMMATVALASLVLTYLLIQFNNKVLPEANHRAKSLIIDIRRIKPTLTIVPGLFSQEVQGYSILTRKTFEHSNDLEGITIYDYTDATTNVVVTAERGTVSFTPDYRKLVMDLHEGEIHQMPVNEPDTYRRVRFRRHRIVMNAEGFEFERSNEGAFSRSDRELSASQMQAIVDSLEEANAAAEVLAVRTSDERASTGGRLGVPLPPNAPDSLREQHAILQAIGRERSIINAIDNQLMLIGYNRKQMNEYLVEIHKKYSIPTACLIFVFIGVPLGIMARRGTFGVAASLSLGFFLLYWASLIGGEKLADRGFIAPWVGMWMANILLAILGAYLTLRAAKETPTLSFSWARRFIPRVIRETQGPSGEGRPA